MRLQPDIIFQIAVLADVRDRIDKLAEMASIDWLYLKQSGGSVLDFYRGSEVISSLDLDDPHFDLQHLLGIVVVGTTEKFEECQSKWNSALPSAGVALKHVPAWNPSAILKAGIECITDSLKSHRYQSGLAALELATYRREFDRLQHNFARLEQYVGSHSFRAPTEIFEYTPEIDLLTEKGRKTISAGASAAPFVVQSLPVDSLGFAVMSIYVSSKPDAAGEPLRVSLRAVETAATLGEWMLDPIEVQIGWVELALNNAIDESALSLELVVEWPKNDDEWALALGPPHPFGEFCAQTQDGENLGAPMALRLFSGLPGVRVPATTHSIRPANAPSVLAQFLPYAEYAAVTQVVPPMHENKLTLVFYDQEIGCLTVHPREGGPTVARLNVVLPKNAWSITAEVNLAHEKASPTSFALVVCAQRDESRELSRIRQFDSPSPSFSGWKTLSPLESRSICVILPPSPEEHLSIYLLTRQSPDQSPDFGWARFSKIQFNLLPASVIDAYKADAVGRSLQGMTPSGDEFASKSIAE